MNTREIKFRAWHKELEDMTLSYKNEVVFWNKVSAYPEMYEIMQYTGLKDKNNKEIYEGDLLISDGIVYEANWKGCLYGRSKIGYPLACDNPNRIKDKFEIIGNIHETPHLIKNQTD